MTEILDRPLDIPAAWKGRDMARTRSWVHAFSDDEIAELEAALAAVKRRGLRIPQITRRDFALPRLGPVLAEILDELERGRGFVLLRGLPVDRLGEDDASTIYWGIACHLGSVPAQNMMGDVLGHVRAAARQSWDVDFNVRGYQTTSYLPYHCDKGDIVGLLCLHEAKAGGESCIASSVAIHNEILRTRPDLHRVLYEPFFTDLRGEELEGEPPYYLAPVYAWHEGRLFSRLGTKYVESAQRFPEVPRLTDLQVEALALVDRLAWDDEFRLDMMFKQGDMQFLNNHVVMHSRKEYRDYDEPERRRHLLRVLVHTPSFADVPEYVATLNHIVHGWGENPRPGKVEAAE